MRNVVKSLLITAVVSIQGLVFADSGNILRNPDCEKIIVNKKGGRCFSRISLVNYSGSQGSLEIDKDNVKSGRFSAKLKKIADSKNKGWTGVHFKTQSLKLLAEKTKFKVSFNLQGENVTHGYVVITALDKNRKNNLWKQIYSFKGTFEWKTINKTIEVPKDTILIMMSIRLDKGPGTLWVDDCSIEKEQETTAGKNSSLVNPGFEKGQDTLTGIPEGWNKKEFEGYEAAYGVKLVKPGVEGKQAVSLVWQTGGTKSGIESDAIKAGIVRGFKFTAKIKTAGDGKAALMVEAFDAKNQMLDRFFSAPVDSADWKETELSFCLPDKTVTFKLGCVVMGKGQACFDALRLDEDSKTAKKYKFPLQATCYPVNSVEIWNHGKAVFHTFADSPCSLTFHFKGIRNKLKDTALVLEMPEDIKLEECFNTHPSLRQVEHPEVTTFGWGGKNYKRYTFKNPHMLRILQPTYASGRQLTIGISPKHKNMTGKVYSAFWYLENAGKRTPRSKFGIEFLPPLPKLPNPKNFIITYWDNSGAAFVNDDLFKRACSKYKEANMIGYPRRWQWRDRCDRLAAESWKMFVPIWSYNAKPPYVKEFGAAEIFKKLRYRVMDNGKTDKGKICPTYFNNTPELSAYLEKALARKFKTYGCGKNELICIDSEPWSPQRWCYCEQCREAFAKRFKLKKVPSIAEIKANFLLQWREFRCEQSTKSVSLYSKWIRKAMPGATVFDYDYPIDFDDKDYARAFDGCAKDPVRNEKYIDGHMSSYYHRHGKKAFDLIRCNIKNLKKEYYTVLAIDGEGYLNRSEVLSPRKFKLMLLATAALGGKGVSIYSSSETDGRFFQEINKGMAEIAALQDFFDNGRLDATGVKVNGLPYQVKKIGGHLYPRPIWKNYLGTSVRCLGAEKLISIFNFNGEKSAYVNVSIKGLSEGIYSVINPITKIKLLTADAKALQKGITVLVPIESCLNLLIRKSLPEDAKLPSEKSQLELRADYKKLFSDNSKKSSSSLLPIAEKGISIEPGLLKGSEDEVVMVKNPVQRLLLSISAGAAVKSWQVGDKVVCNPQQSNGSSLFCESGFWLPKSQRGRQKNINNAKIVNVSIKNGLATVVIEAGNPQNGLSWTKTYTVNSSTPGFKAAVKFKNNGKENLPVSFWLRNVVIGRKAKISLPLNTGIMSLEHSPEDIVVPASGIRDCLGFKANPKDRFISKGWISVLFPQNEGRVMIKTDIHKLQLAYIWMNQTVELISRPEQMAPGATDSVTFQYEFSK